MIDRKRKSKLTQEELYEINACGRKADAEAQKAIMETRRAQAWAEMEELALGLKRLEQQEILAQDVHHEVYKFVFAVDPVSVNECMETLNLWHRTKPKCDMEIMFTSPGGSIVSGLALYDYIQALKRKGHKITTKTYGIAASMAGVLLQAGTERVAGKESWVLIHEGSLVAMGKVPEIEDTLGWVKRVGERLVDIFSERAALKTKKPQKQIAAFIRKNWARKDWWLSSDECLKYGFIDRIE